MEVDKATEGSSSKDQDTTNYDELRATVDRHVTAARQGQLVPALEALMALEKQYRLAEDVGATKLCCNGVVDACVATNDWNALNEHILIMAKRRGQLKQAIKSFVDKAMTYIPATPNRDTKVQLINTLQSVTEGKIFVEIERARLTKMLATLYEAEGDIDQAAEVLQEVAVETFGAMAKTEKIAYILDQVRLCLDKDDYIRAQILAKKISPRAFTQRKGEAKGDIGIEGTAIQEPEEGTPSLPALKMRYYELMIRYHSHNDSYLEMCRCYKAIYESDEVKDDSTQWIPVLKKICWLLVLSPSYSTAESSGSDRLTLLTTTLQDKRLEELPLYKELLQTFNTHEVVLWSSVQQLYGGEVAAQAELFSGTRGEKRRDAFKQRVIEHNILVASKYYSRVHLKRLAVLVDLSVEEMEKHLSNLIVAKALHAKINRPAGVVTFKSAHGKEDVLNAWGNNISKLLATVEKTCQQIQKESMQYKVPISAN